VAVGWKHLLFLDDDVFAHLELSTLNSRTLSRAVQALSLDPSLKAVGWTSENFNDNSTVGHARSFTGKSQGVFLGAGALLVRCSEQTPFFPAIYNEDWLFMLALAARSRRPRHSLGRIGAVGQLRYDPFVPARAKREEAGDILAEGLLNLLEDHGRNFAKMSTAEFWESAIDSRRSMILEIRAAVRGAAIPPDATAERNKVRGALDAALGVNKRLIAPWLVEWVDLWIGDFGVWEQFLSGAPRQCQAFCDPVDVLKRFAYGDPPFVGSTDIRPTAQHGVPELVG
jgi:hypothetical protein